ncbi:MAG TPA: hypothetical protein VJ144_06325, partial [Candidatus Polarisedimenticolia bacterium]|nr:hypothetical protein [Candidatus Polarisedimenticolia bacterium]
MTRRGTDARSTGMRRLLVLGAGPIGLEAALHASILGYDARVLEAGREVGAHVLSWGHVRMFSPWRMNCSALGLETLRRAGHEAYRDGDVCPTGSEYVRRYLAPLARAALKGRVLRRTRVLAIGRAGLLKGDLIGKEERGLRPFRVLAGARGRESIWGADLIIDATGTYGQSRWLGDGGIAAPGEREASSRIDYRLMDLSIGRARDRIGRRILLVGSGHSAATSAVALAGLVEKHPRTRILWSVRSGREPLYPRQVSDPLPMRDRLAAEANAIARGSVRGIETLPMTVVESITPARGGNGHGPEAGGSLAVTLRSGTGRTRVTVDRILANVGYAPDRSLYAELQVHECYATGGPIRL